jgi:PAS domain S-box-containing protein
MAHGPTLGLLSHPEPPTGLRRWSTTSRGRCGRIAAVGPALAALLAASLSCTTLVSLASAASPMAHVDHIDGAHFWARYRWSLSAVVVCLTEALLIVGLLAERSKRRGVNRELLRRIAECERVESALRESEARYRGIVEDQTELICRFLPDGTFTFVNGAYSRYFQRPPAELLGRRFWDFVPPEAQKAARDCLDSITTSSPVATSEHEVVAPGGEVRWQQWRDRGIFDEQGRLVEYQSVGRDITERKRGEEERRQLEAQKQVAAALRESDRRKDEFLAILAHELRNPLAPMTLALTVMSSHRLENEELQWARGVVARQLGQLTRLVDDLLDISRITRGQINLEMRPLDLREVVTRATETSRPAIEVRVQTLSLELSDDPLPVSGDAVRLAQVVSNLLNNAAKYTGVGGLIRLSAAREQGEIVLRVTDNGLGMQPEMVAEVFEPFVQLEGARRHAQGGLGIGLTLVKRVVEMHGGKVEAHSAGVGHGSQFVVRLPQAVAPAPEAMAAAVPEPSPSPGARRVLVVDDNIDAAVALGRVLSLQAHEVKVVHDGLAALLAAERIDPDVVFLDLGMPGLDGVQVARRLRERKPAPRPMLVAMTGFGREEDRRRTAEAGFDHHLVKPVDAATVRAVLEHATPRS